MPGYFFDLRAPDGLVLRDPRELIFPPLPPQFGKPPTRLEALRWTASFATLTTPAGISISGAKQGQLPHPR